MQIRPLGEADRTALTTFACARLGEPWAEAVQQSIRDDLSDELAEGRISAVGLFEDTRLCGVAVWRIFPGTPILCRAYTIAVAVGAQRKGYGRELKQAVLEAARLAGAVAVSSIVDRRNIAMLRLNEALGARIEYREDEPDTCYCFITLDRKD